LVEVC